ncbi:MAG: regulatory signaling modulator protein AmpE [Gammaproteobacteria bacterium]|nr:regulatory signaling modulator protein AmpE [Gammaproteobacteria bacterium]MDH5629590.1 regulatory signaling modulator protein AmpE [Gammaproteobacteria bacterium]
MNLIAILIVMAIEFYFRWGSQYRSFQWFVTLQEKIEKQFSDKSFFESWGGVLLVLLAPVAILWLIAGVIGSGSYNLGYFVICIVTLFYSLGPQPLDKSLNSYFEAMERGDEQAAFLVLKETTHLESVIESDDLVRNATRVIFVESLCRYFGVIFWFIFLGPYGALFYRLTHQYYCHCKDNDKDKHLNLVANLIHWINWLPARVTSFMFLLGGDFVNGFYRVKDYLTDINSSNRQVITETGVAAMGIDIGRSSESVSENQNALALIERTIIIYLVVSAVLTFIMW